MNIIKKNAALALFHKVEELDQQSHEGWKCIYFKIPTEHERQKNVLGSFNIDVVSHMLARTAGFAYLCESGELFILYRGTYNSVMNRLSIYLESLYSVSDSAHHQLFSLFDLSVQWKSFYRFCETRYLNAISDGEAAAMLPKPVMAVKMHYNEHVSGYLTSS